METGHDLRVLWAKARLGIEAAFPQEPETLDRIEAIIGEIANLDPIGQSFRYSHGRDEKVNLPPTLTRVNVAHIATVMLKVAIQLEGAEAGMHEMIDAPPDYGP